MVASASPYGTVESRHHLTSQMSRRVEISVSWCRMGYIKMNQNMSLTKCSQCWMRSRSKWGMDENKMADNSLYNCGCPWYPAVTQLVLQSRQLDATPLSALLKKQCDQFVSEAIQCFSFQCMLGAVSDLKVHGFGKLKCSILFTRRLRRRRPGRM